MARIPPRLLKELRVKKSAPKKTLAIFHFIHYNSLNQDLNEGAWEKLNGDHPVPLRSHLRQAFGKPPRRSAMSFLQLLTRLRRTLTRRQRTQPSVKNRVQPWVELLETRVCPTGT